ncbi:MAG: hypothetical protein IK093_17565 [Ruminiclostridium sp.]|nr:hypothetical protein [Ruminiclostridium sp.]
MSEENIIETEETAELTPGQAPKKKRKVFSENTVEVLVAVFLGITALLSAWASWIGSLHGGNQSTNYTKSNNLASEGNSEYNAGMQMYLSDLMAWNTMMEYSFDKILAESEGKYDEAALIQGKLETFAEQNCSPILLVAFQEMTPDMNSPFEVEGVQAAYFVDAAELLEQSREILEEGQRDNANGDAYNLVNVIYSVVLFMLGIVGVFKKIPNRAVVLLIAVIGLTLTTIYMVTIPMPTGFEITSFFKF